MGLKIVILTHMYTLDELEAAGENVDYFIEEVEMELRGEIESSIGVIHKIEFYKNNPDGIVKIKFESALAAETCIKVMNGRFFDGRTVECFYWDGKIDYRINRESEVEVKKRVEEFGDWLDE
jgi:HIV Tat-specific factor 1